MIIIFIGLILLIFFVEIITHRKIRGLLPTVFFLFLMILMGANTQNPDTYIYEELIYNNKEFFYKDFGFGILVQLFKTFELDYYALKMFVTIVGFILINHTLKKYLKDYKYFFVLYLIYPFFFDVVQVRNFFAMSIMIFAIPFLLEHSKKGNIKYVISILIAASMQKTALVYLPIVFIKKMDMHKYLKTFFKIIILISIGIAICRPLLNAFVIFLITNISDVLVGIESKLSVQTNFGWILQWAIQITNYGLIYTCKKYIDEEADKNLNNLEIMKMQNYIHLVYNVNYYMFIFLPLYILTPTFSRIMRNILILNYIVYAYFEQSIYLNENNLYKKRYINLTTLVFIFNLIFYVFQYIYSQSGYFSEMVIPILTENWILKLLKI